MCIRRKVGRGEVAKAAALFCLADWMIVLVALLIVPAVAVAVVPIIIARIVSTLPYLDQSALRPLIMVSLGVGVVVGALSRIDLGLDDEIPEWVVTAVVIFFVPVGVAIADLDLWQHSTTLLETTQEALRKNAELTASERALADQAQELRDSRARLVTAADMERRRIERDLHDGAQQTLIGLCLGLSVLAERQAEGSPVGAELRRLENFGQEAVVELRELAHGVYPPILAAQGLAPALEAVLWRSRLPVRADIECVRRCSPEKEAAIYFCCREALQNADKHAGEGAAVEFSLREDPAGTLRFSVADNGCGFAATSNSGIGLVNMRDRLAAVGGSLSVHSSPRGGTCVTGLVPAIETEPCLGFTTVAGGMA